MNKNNIKKNLLYSNLKKYHMGSEHSISGKELEYATPDKVYKASFAATGAA